MQDRHEPHGKPGDAAALIAALAALGKTIAVAESCTGGLIAAALTDIPGASSVFTGGVTAYAESVKTNLLGVAPEILSTHGVVSAEVARAMVENAAQKFAADYAVATTGYAGPGGGTRENPTGSVWFGFKTPSGVSVERMRFPGDRAAVRRAAVAHALGGLLTRIDG